MNVLLSSSTIDRSNGYGNITYEFSRSLVEKGVSVTLLLPRDTRDEIPVISGLKIERILPPYLFQAIRPKLFEYLLWKYDNKSKFDIVHSLFETPYAPLMARESRRRKIPFVMGAQGTYGVKPLTEQPERFLLKYAYRTAKTIIVPSAYTKKTILKESGENYDITVIHNGVDFDRFNTATETGVEIRKQYPGKQLLLTVGQLKNRKGQDMVIKALPAILKQHPDTMYLLVGDDGWNGYLNRLAQEVGVSDHVVFVGSVAGKDVPKYFHGCDVYVHTARISGKYYFEGFGIVYLEAAACGKPSVGTDAGGITDALLHEKTGFVAENENIEQVADYINKLLSDQYLRKKMGNEAQEYARLHRWSHITEQYLKVYEDILKKDPVRKTMSYGNLV